MVVFRPVTIQDLDGVHRLAELADFGLTTLPSDRTYLKKRIEQACRAFETIPEEPQGEAYFFVLEDLDTGELAGTSGIYSRVGGFEPFYAYRIETVLNESETLGVRKEIKTLHLVAEHDGPSEIGTLFLAPDYRKSGLGRFLSKSRFLFMGRHRRAFSPLVISELRGVIEDGAHSPFWEALGRHFFDVDFPKADYESLLEKKFIAELMPEHPIYINLFPEDVQAIIGEVHEKTKPAQKILEEEGFAFSGMIDIFDAGPILSCPLEEITTIRNSREDGVREITTGLAESDPHIIANSAKSFRACLGAVEPIQGKGVRITTETAWALELKVGDRV